MNATNGSVARFGWIACSVLALAVTGCRTHVVHRHTHTVYVPAPPPVVHPPPAPPPQPARPAPQPPPEAVAAPPQAPAPQPPPPVVVAPVVIIQTESDFHEPLAAYGRWVVVGSHGRCWVPVGIEAGWRPYCNGHWERTDAGWYWVSDEPWGWATYHYGRWDWRADFGWFWVPQIQWAPAWVCWREGGGYIGWAPLRPSVTVGVTIGNFDYEPVFAARAFVFVEHRRMLDPVRPRTVVVNNTTVINKTVNVTKVKVVNKTVINEGPRVETIERASGRKLQAGPAHEFRRREETPVTERRRTVPAAPEPKIHPVVRDEPRRIEKQATPAPTMRPDEKPAAVSPSPTRPVSPPLRPTPAPTVATKPSPNERQPTAVLPKRNTPNQPAATRPTQSAPAPARPAPVSREIRAVERPATVVKPAAPPAVTAPVRSGRRPEVGMEQTPAVPQPTVAPTPRSAVRTAPNRAAAPTQQPAVQPPAVVRQPPTTPAPQGDDMRLVSPKDKSRTAKRAEPNAKNVEPKAEKRDENQGSPRSSIPTRSRS